MVGEQVTLIEGQEPFSIMKWTQRTWSSIKELVVCNLILATTFLTTGLIVDIVQFILYITIRPFNARFYRKINYYITYTLNSQIVFMVEWWAGCNVQLYSDPDEVEKYFGKEHAYLLLNHCYEVDWLMGWVVCDRSQILGNAKVYAKKILQYAPVLGWSWKFQEIVFLERDWEKDQKSLGIQLTRLTEYPDPFWLVLFPEGTRFTPKKHALSMEVARQKGLPELKHHLLPRTRGFVESVKYLKNKVPAIYDVTVGFTKVNEFEPTVFNLLNGKPMNTTLMITRIPMSEVPDDPVEAAAWLQTHYQKKDKLLGNYIETGKFVPNDDMEEYKKFRYFELPRRPYSLINYCTWMIVIFVPLLWYLFSMLTSGSYLYSSLAIFFVAAAYLGVVKLINLTRISKSSSYGHNESSSPSSSNGPTATANGKQKVQTENPE